MSKLLLVLAYGLVRLLTWTYRFEFPVRGTEGGYVLAIWHQNLFAGILAQTGHRHIVIVSRSRDGDPVAYMCLQLGHEVVRGSSKKRGVDKGGKQAKDEMITLLQSGLPGAVTVDGPSGPAHVVKPGIIEMARLAAVPIVPYLAIAQRYWTFNSWDAFRLPKPFTRIKVYYGAPISVPADTDAAEFSAYQQRVAEALQAAQREHDRNDKGISAAESAR